MQNRKQGRFGHSGMTYIEIMAASLIIGVSLLGIVSTWYFAFGQTVNSNDMQVGYNLARQTLEQVKEAGFDNASEAPVASPIIHYFDATEQNRDSSLSLARYKISTTVVSGATISGSNPVKPADNTLRTVTVTVTLYPKGTSLCQLNTYLVKSGI